MPRRAPGRGTWLAVALVIAVGALAELRSVARPDIGFLLYAAGRVLDGARMYVDVVEINPPLIIALNVPPVLFARLLGVSEILVYRVIFALVLCGGLALAWRALQRAMPDESGTRRWAAVLLAFVLFPLAAQDFGQREHLLLALILPYLLSAAGRLRGAAPSRGEAIALGTLTGIGLALKPHFLLVWAGTELVLRRRQRTLRPFPETAAIAALLGVYAAAVLLLTPEYLDLVLLVGGLYGKFLREPFAGLLLTGPGAALIWLALLSWLALRDRARHPEVWTMLVVGVLTCFLGGAAQQKGLRYHFFPAFALSILFLGYAAVDARSPLRSGVQRIYRVVALSAAVTSLLVVAVENMGQIVSFGRSRQEAEYRALVRLVRERAKGGSIFVMSYHIGSAFPLINYSGVTSASRFPQLWILAAAYREALELERPLAYRSPAQMPAAERYLNESVLADFSAHEPRLLLVLRNARDLPVNGYRRLDYLAYFGRDPRMAGILERYESIGVVGEYALYARVAPGAPRRGPPPRPTAATEDIVRTDREGLRLPLGDPAFLLRLAVFGLVLGTVIWLGRTGRLGSTGA